MRMFYMYNCTDLVLDCAGQGLGVYDAIIKDTYDAEYGITYDAMTCVNDKDMADRCKVKTANKVIWSIKANATFNTQAAFNLRAAFQNNKINLLISDFEADEAIKKIRGYNSMNSKEQAQVKAPFLQTSLMINELINLEHEVKGTNVKIKERSGMRKDRFSSLEYNIYVAQELARKLKPKNNTNNLADLLPIRPPKKITRF